MKGKEVQVKARQREEQGGARKRKEWLEKARRF
jgi:hypothetical protein